MPLQQFDEKDASVFALQLTDATAPGVYQFWSASNNLLRRVDVFQICNNDTIDHTVLVDYIMQDGTGVAGAVPVPSGAGFGATPPVDAIAYLLPAAFHYIMLTYGNYIGVAVGEAINTGKLVTLNWMGGLV